MNCISLQFSNFSKWFQHTTNPSFSLQLACTISQTVCPTWLLNFQNQSMSKNTLAAAFTLSHATPSQPMPSPLISPLMPSPSMPPHLIPFKFISSHITSSTAISSHHTLFHLFSKTWTSIPPTLNIVYSIWWKESCFQVKAAPLGWSTHFLLLLFWWVLGHQIPEDNQRWWCLGAARGWPHLCKAGQTLHRLPWQPGPTPIHPWKVGAQAGTQWAWWRGRKTSSPPPSCIHRLLAVTALLAALSLIRWRGSGVSCFCSHSAYTCLICFTWKWTCPPQPQGLFAWEGNLAWWGLFVAWPTCIKPVLPSPCFGTSGTGSTFSPGPKSFL